MANERLRQAIRQAGLDPDELADRVEVDVKTVYRWISGITPRPRHRDRILGALGRSEHELWPDIPSASPPDHDSGAEILGAWPHADDPGVPDWRELLDQAIEQVELLDYSLLDILAGNGVVEALRAKADAGCRVRVVISAPDSIWVRARAKAVGKDEEDYIGRTQLALELETARGHLEPLTQVESVELHHIYADPGQRMLRFDEEMLLSPNLHGVHGHDAPLIHLRRQQNGGLFDQLAAHLDTLARDGTRITPAPALYPDPLADPGRYQPLTATTYRQQLDELSKRETESSEKPIRPLEQVRAELRRPQRD